MSVLVFQVNGVQFHGCEIRASSKEKQAGLGVFAMEDNTQGLVFFFFFSSQAAVHFILKLKITC